MSYKQWIDTNHLSHQTLGEETIAEDVLSLFTAQAEDWKTLLRQAQETSSIASLAHKMKGSARGIGAFPLAGKADEVEQNPEDSMARQALLQHLNETCNYINDHKPMLLSKIRAAND